MKLKEFLKTLNDDEIVAIGAGDTGSSGYVYISNAGNEDLINKAFKDNLKLIKRRIKTRMATLTSLILTPPELSEVSEKTIKEHAKLIWSAFNSIRESEAFVEGYIPPLEREVIETYDKHFDDCTAIIIKGKENGRFSLKSEFDAKYC